MEMAGRAPIPGFGLEAPTHQRIIASFERYIGPAAAEALWAEACAETGVSRYGHEPSVADLQKVVLHIAARRGVVGICATAVNVRLLSYAMLARAQENIPPATVTE